MEWGWGANKKNGEEGKYRARELGDESREEQT